MMIDAIKRVPSDFVGLGRTLGLSDRKTLSQIVIPSALPSIWDALRISLGWAWTWLVLAELVASTSGLGYRIVVSQRYFQTDTDHRLHTPAWFRGSLLIKLCVQLSYCALFRYNRRRS
jgi:NitT/TauT family transport system permease protein